jgi:sugar phosphate isomerase/epimerase
VTVDDALAFLARIEGGAMGTFEARCLAPGRKNRNSFEVNGSKGSLAFDVERMYELQLHLEGDSAETPGFRTINVTKWDRLYTGAWWPPGHILGYENTLVHTVKNLLDGIGTCESPAPTFEDGYLCQAVLNAWSGAYRAVAGSSLRACHAAILLAVRNARGDHRSVSRRRMARFRYSYNVISYRGEEISRSIDRVGRLGYDAIEAEGEPERLDPNRLKKLTDDAGLEISSVCPAFTAERDLSHPDPRVRKNAVGYVREVAELAHALGAPTIIVAPTSYPRTRPIADSEDEWRWAVESIRAVGEYAQSLGVDLTLECWNRFGTYMLNRLEQGVRMWRETGLTNGGVMADTFHMNIEERSLLEAIRETGELLNHVHLADSNRLAPGLGHTDFDEILRALLDIDYRGYLTFELIVPDQPGADRREESLDYATHQAIEHVKKVEERLSKNR